MIFLVSFLNKDLSGETFNQIALISLFDKLSYTEFWEGKSSNLKGNYIVAKIIGLSRHKWHKGLKFTSYVKIVTFFNGNLSIDDIITLVNQLNIHWDRVVQCSF
jgi:hypothetical protein